MNLSNMLIEADFILAPDAAELALLPLILTVYQPHVPDGTGLEAGLLVAHQAPPGRVVLVPGQVLVYIHPCKHWKINK